MMVLGPRLGTRLGTLEPMPMCALRAHACAVGVVGLCYDASDAMRMPCESTVEGASRGNAVHAVRGLG